MNIDNVSPEFIDSILDKLVKQYYIKIQFTVKPDIAREIITFAEKVISEEVARRKW